MNKYLTILILLLSGHVVSAATIPAASANFNDVQTATNSAVNGDIVTVPAGTATWTQTLNLGAKAVSIIGAGTSGSGSGTGHTIINNSVGALFYWQNVGAVPFRLAGFRFNNSDGQVPVVLRGPITKVRIDHIICNKGDHFGNFNDAGNWGLGPVWGVVDHSDFYNMTRPFYPQDVRGTSYTGSNRETYWGKFVWAPPVVNPGTDQFMYVEDCRFIWDSNLTATNAQGAIYGTNGGSLVFRYNVCTGFVQYIDAHGDQPASNYVPGVNDFYDRSTLYYEIYENDFIQGATSQGNGGGNQRGGWRICHDNRFTTNPGDGVIKVMVYTPGDVNSPDNTYYWNDTWNGVGNIEHSIVHVVDSGNTPPGTSAARIREGIEIFYRAPQAGDPSPASFIGYTPLVHPHPLVSGVSTGPGTLALSSSSASGPEGGGSVTVTVIRSDGTTGAVGVSYATSNGTATAGSDFTATSGTLSWADGDGGSKTFNIPILQDASAEGNESFNITLSSPTGGATLGLSTAAITIVDDEAVTPPLMTGLTFEAEAGLVEPPYTVAGGLVSQSIDTTTPSAGGRIRWRVTIPSTGDYTVAAGINAADNGMDSLFIDWDQEPVAPTAIWLVTPFTVGVEQRTANWVGSATGPSPPEFMPKVWNLTAGVHTLYVRGREAGCVLDNITVAAVATAQVQTPAFSVPDGSYLGAQSVTITSTAGADIRYTTNGTTPTASSTLYTGPVALNAPTTLKAIGIKSGMTNSTVATAVYEINAWTSDSSVEFENILLPVSTGAFDYTFDVTPSLSNSYTVLMIAPGLIDETDDWAIAIWFDPNGKVLARNDNTYTAVNDISYIGGNTYRVHITGPAVSGHIFNATVNGTTLATSYLFRTSQAAATQLSYLGLQTHNGSTLTVPITSPQTPLNTINATNLIIGH